VVKWPRVPGKSRKTAKKSAKNAGQRRREKATPGGAAEPLVREERNFLRSAFATPLVGIIIIGPGGERLFVNDCAVARTGYTREEYLALPISKFALPEDFEQDMEGLRRMVAGEIDHESRVRRFVRKDGTTYWASTSVHCARGPDGRVTHLYFFVTDLSDLKKTEAALKASEARYRDLVDLSPFAVVLHREGRIEFANRAALAMHGAEGAEGILGRPALDFVHPDARDRVRARMETLRTGGKVPSMQERFLRLDGSAFDVEAAATSFHDQRGPAVQVVFRDVTERKRVEEALRESEQRFRTVVENSLEGITVLDLASGRYAFVSPAQAAMTGFSVEELLAMSARDVLERVHPEDRHVSAEQQSAIEAGHEPGSNVEYRWKVKSGEYRWISDSRKAIRDGQGRPMALVGVSFDVTDRKRADDSLRESERWLRLSQEIARIGHYLFDVQADHWTSSETLNAIFGIDEGFPRKGSDWLRIVHPDDRHEMEAYLAGLLQRGTRFDREYRVVDQRTGETRWVHGIGDLLRASGGDPIRLVGTIQDITGRKKADIERNALQGQLALAARLAAMGTLVAGVAHEINNPLAGELADQGLALEIVREVRERMRGSAPLSREAEGRMLDGVVEALEDAQECGARIASIVRDLAIFGRSDSQRQRVRLIDVVEGARRWLPVAVARTVSITVEDGDAPEIIAAPGQMEQVVLNLVTNAARATPEGQRNAVVLRTGPGAPGMARLEVVDHGTGIDPAILDRIFEPFFTTRRVGADKGTGLGLAICQAIVASHEGTLTVESEVGKGSTFRLELPAASA
jgi:PAS domain S-box-containing protein